MFCPKCGANIHDNAQFCSLCGEQLSQHFVVPEKVNIEKPAKKKTKTGLIICISIIVAIMVVSLTLLVGLGVFFAINNNDDKPIENQSVENTQIQANLSNWGMACEVGDDIYFSDAAEGIYRNNFEELVVSGEYTDLCYLDGKLFCVEYLYENDKSVYNLVMIDINSNKKTVAYSIRSDEEYLLISNVIDDKVYFVLSDDELFVCDSTGKVESKNIFNTLKVTESGVYTTEAGSSGIKLVNFEYETIKTYDKLSGREVIVFFEYDGYLYASMRDDYGETWTPIRIDIDTGNYIVIREGNAEYSRMNIHKDKLYITSFDEDTRTYSVYVYDLKGNYITVFSSMTYENDYSLLYLISIVDDTLVQSYPYSEVETVFTPIR